MALIEYEVKGSIGILTVNRPKAMNALNSDVLKELRDTLDAVDQNTVRCLIITGAGNKAFVAGADIAQMAKATRDEGHAFSQEGNDTFRKLETFPIPTIAAINGVALGGGCELAMSCDIRLAVDTAVFGQPEAGLGITPGFGGTQRMARLIGIGKAKEMLYTCRNMKAQEALEVGLVQAIYPAEELMAAAEKMANRIAGNAPIAVRMCKKAINEGMQVDMDKAIGVEVDCISQCFATEDQQEAMAAFLEKRKPAPFQNR